MARLIGVGDYEILGEVYMIAHLYIDDESF